MLHTYLMWIMYSTLNKIQIYMLFDQCLGFPHTIQYLNTFKSKHTIN